MLDFESYFDLSCKILKDKERQDQILWLENNLGSINNLALD